MIDFNWFIIFILFSSQYMYVYVYFRLFCYLYLHIVDIYPLITIANKGITQTTNVPR